MVETQNWLNLSTNSTQWPICNIYQLHEEDGRSGGQATKMWEICLEEKITPRFPHDPQTCFAVCKSQTGDPEF